MQEKQKIKDKGNGKGDERNIQGVFENKDALERDFDNTELPSVVKYLVEPGERGEVLKLLMRANIADRPSVVAYVEHYAACIAYGDTEGENEFMALIAAECSSNNGKRIDLLVKAIVGSFDARTNNENLMGKFKEAAGLGGLK